LRDEDWDGTVDLRTVFLDELHSPFGMALVGNDFYVANTDALLRFRYTPGATRIESSGTKIVDLPAGPIYFGQHVDERVQPQKPDLVARAIVPDYALGPHTACLGLAAAKGAALPAPYKEGMFVGQHGSWNRKPASGYKVIFVPFRNGRPSGLPVDFLTGFLSEDGKALDARHALA
jgi:glucose/arabinose dehydrogenase